ncbi:cobalt transporter [Desulfosporosinus sp. Sb-LF]|uniref:cobalt transporter n=1 Tax=Desulfosporosinus sp. Sb-LF TaxID=2560027 RepID=UPI00107EF6A4|nr:cobalt transporter [Desulfosporosinus sp. Sb-LF]TGE33240.1 cobalt transporter [Desulfosporosinus sp. Sb-LF]
MKQQVWKSGFLVLFLGIIIYLGVHAPAMPGADTHVNAVAEKYASEVGAGERPPLINTNKGDLLLFMFAIGGAVAGFVIGYTWRDLFGRTESHSNIQKQ